MKKKVRRIEVRTSKGELILCLVVHDEEISAENNSTAPVNLKAENKTGKGNGSNVKDEDAMTDAQQRYLFRLLADQGIEGDAAHQHLKELFQVNTLQDVTKKEASHAIENMLTEAKGGETHAGSPVK